VRSVTSSRVAEVSVGVVGEFITVAP